MNTRIADGDGGVMVVINAADLRATVEGICRRYEQRTASTLSAHRERPTLTRDDAARILNVNAATLWRWARDGYLVPVKIGRKVLYRPSDIDRLLAKKGGAI